MREAWLTAQAAALLGPGAGGQAAAKVSMRLGAVFFCLGSSEPVVVSSFCHSGRADLAAPVPVVW